jgi:hypothetical protein
LGHSQSEGLRRPPRPRATSTERARTSARPVVRDVVQWLHAVEVDHLGIASGPLDSPSSDAAAPPPDRQPPDWDGHRPVTCTFVTQRGGTEAPRIDVKGPRQGIHERLTHQDAAPITRPSRSRSSLTCRNSQSRDGEIRTRDPLTPSSAAGQRHAQARSPRSPTIINVPVKESVVERWSGLDVTVDRRLQTLREVRAAASPGRCGPSCWEILVACLRSLVGGEAMVSLGEVESVGGVGLA